MTRSHASIGTARRSDPQEFARYFFQVQGERRDPSQISFMAYLSASLLGSRNPESEIIRNLVYLSSLPLYVPFPHLEASEEDSALVVSCTDIFELAESQLLLEPGARKVRYHVLAMKDGNATVGSLDQIYDALALMSQFADRRKPILIHCREGIQRSAMMTALHLAHRYLLDDPNIKQSIDASVTKKLNPESSTFVADLYNAVGKYITSIRPICKIIPWEARVLGVAISSLLTDVTQRRYEFAIAVLTDIHKKIKKWPSSRKLR